MKTISMITNDILFRVEDQELVKLNQITIVTESDSWETSMFGNLERTMKVENVVLTLDEEATNKLIDALTEIRDKSKVLTAVFGSEEAKKASKPTVGVRASEEKVPASPVE